MKESSLYRTLCTELHPHDFSTLLTNRRLSPKAVTASWYKLSDLQKQVLERCCSSWITSRMMSLSSRAGSLVADCHVVLLPNRSIQSLSPFIAFGG